MKKHFSFILMCAMAFAVAGMSVSCGSKEPEEIGIVVDESYTESLAATDVSENFATLNGRITSDVVDEVGFYYGTDKKSVMNAMGLKVAATRQGSNFSQRVGNLSDGVTYYYTTYGIRNGGIIIDQSHVMSFTTKAYDKTKEIVTGEVNPDYDRATVMVNCNTKAKNFYIGLQYAPVSDPIESGVVTKSRALSASDNLSTLYLQMSDLNIEENYHVRAFVEDASTGGRTFGDVRQFATLTPCTDATVDMGEPMGVWCTTNIGADHPWEKGLYFAFAETETRQTFSADTYLIDPSQLPSSIQGTQYDVATVQLGSGYGLPTYSDFDVLCNNCTLSNDVSYPRWHDVEGMLFVSKTNHNALFFPAAGVMNGSSCMRHSMPYYRTADNNAATNIRITNEKADKYTNFFCGGLVRGRRIK